MSPPSPRIAITGPESSGKSVLAGWLAATWRTRWVPEFAREYLLALPDPGAYTLADLEAIARGQLAAESQRVGLLPAGAPLFCDTDLLVILIWAEERFGHCPAWLRTAALDPTAYHLRLLLHPDLPWEPDPLREAPDPAERARLFQRYRATLRAANLPFTEICGTGEARYAAAARAVTAAGFGQLPTR
ncbi:MAG: ATP-binding protein [Hymenobacteraceae bacterium]|nr:ATP-binding protein [Hymenobacteraceae bacterium]